MYVYVYVGMTYLVPSNFLAPPPPPPPPPMGGVKKFERSTPSPKPEEKPKQRVQPQMSVGGGFGPFGFDPSSVKLKTTGRRGASTLPKDNPPAGSMFPSECMHLSRTVEPPSNQLLPYMYMACLHIRFQFMYIVGVNLVVKIVL